MEQERQVSLKINVHTSMEVCVAASESSHTSAGPRYKIVVDYVGVALAVAVARDVTASAAPVVDNLRGKRQLIISSGPTHKWRLTLF